MSWTWNGGTPTNGKPSAFFLDCTCGWGLDLVSEREELAERYSLDHVEEAQSWRLLGELRGDRSA